MRDAVSDSGEHTAQWSRRFANPYLLLTLTALFWSGNMVVGRGVRADVPPLALAFGRWLIAFACVLPFAWPYVRRDWPLVRTHWRSVSLLGLLGVGGYNTLAYIGLQTTSATNAVLLNSFIPVVTIAIAWAFSGKRLSPREAMGVLISLIGALTIVGRGEPAALLALDLNVGDLWLLLAVLVWAVYTVGLGRRPAGVHPLVLLAAFIAVGLVALAPFWLWEMAQGRFLHPTPTAWLALAYVGVLPSFVGYVFYNRGVAEIGPAKASLFIHLMPVFGTLLAALFLGEIPGWFHYLGIALIFTGIVLTMKKF